MPYKDKTKQAAFSLARYHRNHDAFKVYKSTLSCVLCDESDTVCLDFHHINPRQEKRVQFSGSGRNIDKLLEEIAKCIVLCANCHRKEHARLKRQNEQLDAQQTVTLHPKG